MEPEVLEVDGPLEGSVRDRRVRFALRVRDPADGCNGLVQVEGERANQGELIVGTLRISGSCVGAEGASGTFSLRPISREASDGTAR